MSSVWETLSKVDVSDHTEEKNGLTYLSWAWAWGEVKNNFPQAKYVKHIWTTETYLDNPDRPDRGLPYTKDEHGYAYVAVTVRIGEEEQTEIMPVLDYKNKAVQNPDSFQVNTALQRCLAKCCAMHGLGHYIYAGEDLPQGVEQKVTVTASDGSTKDVEGLKVVAEVFNTFIPECADLDTLRKFWGQNKDALEILKKGDKDLYQKVLGNFTAHSETLKPKGEAA
tara:strand:+ start:6584 stop:7255 length:672 start_codon:yes stop_codon:yes gene_type:complete